MNAPVAYFNNDRDRYIDKETVKTVSRELSKLITKQIKEETREGAQQEKHAN